MSRPRVSGSVDAAAFATRFLELKLDERQAEWLRGRAHRRFCSVRRPIESYANFERQGSYRTLGPVANVAMTLPSSVSSWIGPNTRESSLLSRLSPRT